MTTFTPGLVRDRETKREDPGLIETFVPVLPGGRSQRQPQFRPLHLIVTNAERTVVLDWLAQNRPDLLPRSRRAR
jgi:hypothetical protein